MGRTVDRRAAWLVVAIAAFVLAVVAAASSAHDDDQVAVLTRLVTRAERADRQDSTVLERTTRSVGGRTVAAASLRTVWIAARQWSLEQTPEFSFVTTPSERLTCRGDDVLDCLRDSTPVPPRRSAALPYLAAVTTGRYTIEADGTARVAGREAECFVLQVRRPEDLISDLGERLRVCVTADGFVVRSERRSGRVVDLRETTSLRRSVADADVRRMEAAVRSVDGR